MQSEKLGNLFGALVKAQSQIKGALKDSKNPFFHSNYADLESCWNAVRGPLADNGLCVIQTMEATEHGNELVTTLGHVSGEWISGNQLIGNVKPGPQDIGSAITYARRYGLAAITGLVQVDDDAQSVSKPAPIANKPTVVKPKPGPLADDIDKFLGLPPDKPKDTGFTGGKFQLTEGQVKRLWVIKAEANWTDEMFRMALDTYDVASSKDLSLNQYNNLVNHITKNPIGPKK